MVEHASANVESSFPSPRTDLEILSCTGRSDVAEVFVARTRSGDDKSMIEFVDGLDTRYPREEKWIINLSTQFGCPVGCRFCDAGHQYYGNLTVDELMAQVKYVMDRHPGLASRCGKLKVHFARMGEPSFNDNVLKTMEKLPEFMQASHLWSCVPTTVPMGREAWFERLYEVKEKYYRGRFQLQFSLNTTDPDERARLMPIRLQNMDWVADYGHRFFQDGDRKPILNFALARHVAFDPDAVISRFDPEKIAVKLTPLNPTQTGQDNGLDTILRTEDSEAIDGHVKRLNDAGFDVVISIGDGREDEIGSNCGQSVRRMRDPEAQ